jgi:hypothetical protein
MDVLETIDEDYSEAKEERMDVQGFILEIHMFCFLR